MSNAEAKTPVELHARIQTLLTKATALRKEQAAVQIELALKGAATAKLRATRVNQLRGRPVNGGIIAAIEHYRERRGRPSTSRARGAS